jgi:hypothetical protein
MPCFHYVTTLILMWTVQQAPDCDMALVHDDDLVRILGVGDGAVRKGSPSMSVLIDPFMSIVLGDPPTRCADELPSKVEA